MNGMLVYMADEQAAGEDAAYEFLEKAWKCLGKMGFSRCS